ncbi:MAG: hypothetical protein H6822_20345 [Planctomycetaceae bacterium]|nr:hypothetical protein [Planctomycetaceae bacterium]
MRRKLSTGLVVLLVFTQFITPIQATPPLEVLSNWLKPGTQHRRPPISEQDQAIEELARNIDWLEKQINQWGTVVAKAPDVWGEARLTAHRQEIEKELAKELTLFDRNRISGAQFVSDSAMLAAAFALKSQEGGPTNTNVVAAPQISATSSTGVDGQGNPTAEIKTTLQNPSTFFGTAATDVTIGEELKLEQTEVLDQLNRYLHHQASLRRINEGGDTADTPGYSLNLVRIPVSVMPGKHSKKGYGAEIAITATPHLGPELLPLAYRDFVINDLVDQLSVPITRYLNNDRFRVNRLMTDFENIELQFETTNQRWQSARATSLFTRSDVKELLSRLTSDQQNKFAKFRNTDGSPTPENITIDNVDTFLTPIDRLLTIALEEDLNQINVVQSIATTNDATDDDSQKKLEASKREIQDVLRSGSVTSWTNEPAKSKPLTGDATQGVRRSIVDVFGNAQEAIEGANAIIAARQDDNGSDVLPAPDSSSKKPDLDFSLVKFDLGSEETVTSPNGVSQYNRAGRELAELVDLLFSFTELKQSIPVVALPVGSRRAVLPFPHTKLVDIYGMHALGHIARSAHQAFQADVVNRRIVHITDTQSFVREELAVAYDLLTHEDLRSWWNTETSGQRVLYTLIRRHDTDGIRKYRENFIKEFPGGVHNLTANFAWCIFVESILLNERLIQDMRETAGNRPCACDVPAWMPFFGPDPPVEARMAFNEYVRCRWPVRVFALDPVVNEQNIADISSVYRQMQMAVVLAFAGGEIGTSAAMQAVRKLQRDRATIDLNRTAVAFGHGEDTFGWRFYPRFQTPPVEGNMTVLFRDLILGGPTDRQLEHSSEIEPGMRECVAVVLMPSFVPYMTIDTRGNWFKLTNPGQTAMSITETVEYSRSIRAMQDSAMMCVQASHLYRNGEVDRLMRRVHQLDRKLPLQTLPCQVPIENTHGGFEIFSSGTRELAPELLGWYGAPGYDRSRPTTMFLAGDNFSISQSRLIVGNQQVTFKLLSRQIMEVTLPPGLPFLRDENLYEKEMNELYDGYVDAHIATPYGVSGHLLIPVVRESRSNTMPHITMPPTTLDVAAEYTVASKALTATPTSQSFPCLNVMPFLNVDLPVAKTTLYPIVGNDRLPPVKLADVEHTYGGQKYDLHDAVTDSLKQKAGATNLHKVIKDYLDYLATGPRNGRTDDFTLPIDLGAEVEVGSRKIPVEGQFRINFKVDVK